MNRIWLVLLPACLVFNAYSQTYIDKVTVVDVLNQKLLTERTVVLKDGVINDILSSRKVKIPNGAEVIDGKGKYLMPGMTDAHVHFFQSGGLYTRPDAIDLRKYVPYEREIDWVHENMEDLLKRYLKAGITSVVDDGATLRFLSLRDSLSNKAGLPSVYMTGPLLTTYEPEPFKGLGLDEPFNLVTSVEDAKRLVREQLPYRPDFIKIWYIVAKGGASLETEARKLEPVVKAIIDEAHKHNLKVAVHATERLTAEIAVRNGGDILVHNVEDELVSESFIKLLKERNVILCPTLIVADNYLKTFAQTIEYSTYDFSLAHPTPMGSIFDLKHLSDTALVASMKERSAVGSPRAVLFAERDSLRRTNLKRLVAGGVSIAAGTDAGNIGTQHASSYVDELKAMAESGMTNWQVLQAATINGAKVFGKEEKLGTVSKGKIADLVLVSANPVEDLMNLRKIDLVFKSGIHFLPDDLLRPTAENLVQQQLNGYNARNIEAFMEPFSEDVEIYGFPEKLVGKGKEQMKQNYAAFFEKFPELHCELESRIVQGNVVIDKERVHGIVPSEIVEAIAIYEVEAGKIKKVTFIQ